MLGASKSTIEETADTAHQTIRLHSLTGLRFFAAGLVLVGHLVDLLVGYGSDSERVAHLVSSSTFIGVGFFFVLSGFVLTWTHREALPVRNFYGRRVARIYPLHLATAVIAAALIWSWGQPIPLLPAALNVFLLHSWVPIEEFASSLNSVSWTLSCEAFFYLCFPLLVRVVGRARLTHVTALMTTLMVATTVAAISLLPEDIAEQILYHNPLIQMGEFVIGIVLATAIRRGFRLRLSIRAAAVVWIGFYIASVAMHFSTDQLGLANFRQYDELLTLPATCLLIMAAASNDLAGQWSPLRSRWLILLGDASYALYMTHALIIREYVHVFGMPSLTAAVGVGAVLAVFAVAVSVGVYVYFERPLERILRSRLGTPPGHAPQPT